MNLVASWLESLLVPLLLMTGIVLLDVPGMISLLVWLDPTLLVACWVKHTLSLHETWLNLISSWLESLLVPFFLVTSIVLLSVPGMVSLLVWLNP